MEPIEQGRPFLSTIDDLEEFVESKVWKDIVSYLEMGIEGEKENCVHAESMKELITAQAMIQSLHNFLQLPEAIKGELRLYLEQLKTMRRSDGNPPVGPDDSDGI